jgi:hypothetical protein
MRTLIKFSGDEGNGLSIEGDAQTIVNEMERGARMLAATRVGNGARVWINVEQVAYLQEFPSGD